MSKFLVKHVLSSILLGIHYIYILICFINLHWLDCVNVKWISRCSNSLSNRIKDMYAKYSYFLFNCCILGTWRCNAMMKKRMPNVNLDSDSAFLDICFIHTKTTYQMLNVFMQFSIFTFVLYWLRIYTPPHSGIWLLDIKWNLKYVSWIDSLYFLFFFC